MYIILKKVSANRISDLIDESLDGKNQDLLNKVSDLIDESLDGKNQDLLNKIDELEKDLTNSLENIDFLVMKNTQNEERMLYLETLLKDIHTNVVDDKICPICNSKIPAFLPYGIKPRANAMCPNCGSLERHRGGYLFLKEKTDFFKKNIRMLHFAPEGFLAELFSNKKNIEYLPVDINPNLKHVKEKMDIQDIKYPDNTFDLIYCSHVLEHIPNDKKALSELCRVIKPDGAVLIMTPLNHSKKTFEDSSINTPELRLEHYLQSDHLRLYGLDFPEKLENAGFKVSKDFMEKLDENSIKKYGLNTHDIVFFCTK